MTVRGVDVMSACIRCFHASWEAGCEGMPAARATRILAWMSCSMVQGRRSLRAWRSAAGGRLTVARRAVNDARVSAVIGAAGTGSGDGCVLRVAGSGEYPLMLAGWQPGHGCVWMP